MNTCSICTENIESDDSLVITNCKHFYHEECLQEWIKHRNICPYCTQSYPLVKYKFLHVYYNSYIRFVYNHKELFLKYMEYTKFIVVVINRYNDYENLNDSIFSRFFILYNIILCIMRINSFWNSKIEKLVGLEDNIYRIIKYTYANILRNYQTYSRRVLQTD